MEELAMKKYKIKKTMTILFAVLVLFSGCGKKDTALSTESNEQEQTQPEKQTQEQAADTAASGKTDDGKPAPAAMRQDPGTSIDYGSPEEGAIRAITLADAHGNLYYVDVNVGTFFTAPIPEDLTDSEGKTLSPDSVKAGWIVDIYGNGMMLESYPGQYPGVTKMVLVKEGTAEDTAPYQYLVDEITMPADPSEPPSMNAEYKTDLAVTTVILTRGSYEWSYTDENGQSQNVTACAPHILAWPELNDIRLDESMTDGLPLTLTASYKPQSVNVARFPFDAWKKDAASESVTEDELSGEPVKVQDTDNGYTMTAEAGYIYLIEAVWEEGRVEFGFYTK